MPSAAWFAASPYPADHMLTKSQRRAIGTAGRIMDKYSDVALRRNGVFQPVQTVRIEGRGTTLNQGTRDISNSVTYQRGITIFGVKDHPSLPDLDIQVGDIFGYAGGQYTVIGVTLHAGEIQAAAERQQP